MVILLKKRGSLVSTIVPQIQKSGSGAMLFANKVMVRTPTFWTERHRNRATVGNSN
jgi:hypothetical protein